MGISRAAQTPTSIHRSVCVNRIRRRDVNQVRCLWWWGKHSRGWWTSQPDDMEERLRRTQALMMHRYTKALRRRSLWDRDNSPSYPSSRWKACKMDRDMSSTDSMWAKVEDRQPEKKTEKQAWHEFHKDFDSFKRALDRAIERDAYGTLFGRRLRSPDTANNSSWTSWSWIFDPKEVKEDPIPEPKKSEEKSASVSAKETEIPQAQSNNTSSKSNVPQPSMLHSSSSSKTTTTLTSSHSFVFQDRSSTATEYIYDPISGRKIPQTSPSSSSAINAEPPSDNISKPQTGAPQKGFIETLFTENATEIPVKVYKPHKVYGHTGDAKQKSKPEESASTATKPSKPFGSSRKREYDSLRLRTIGNNIDATNFNCEPWNNKEAESATTEVNESIEKRVRRSPAPTEDTPLFSGTTYESKSEGQITRSERSSGDSDFRAKQGMTMPSMKSDRLTAERTSERSERIEPALDRVNSETEIPVKRFASKLQPAMDRSFTSARLEPATERAVRSSSKTDHKSQGSILMPAPPTKEEPAEQQDRREDVDLLRASDIRAGTKTARVTKQAVEDKKQQDREILEKDFEHNATSDKSNLESVWKHVRQYPQGIVAKTMQTIGLNNLGGQEKPSPAPIKAEVKFSEPTVRPDVIRNLRMENHTQVFEPEVVRLIDHAKLIQRGLQQTSLIVHELVEKRALIASKPMANGDVAIKKIEPTSVATKPVEAPYAVTTAVEPLAAEAAASGEQAYENARFVVLLHLESDGHVQVKPMDELSGDYPPPRSGFSLMSALGSLTNPSDFIKHFADLDTKGFELVSGARNTLVFRKGEMHSSEQSRLNSFNQLSKAELKADIAAAEAAAQPRPQTTTQGSLKSVKAAEVLDQIPTTIPMPGPAAPTAPTSSITHLPTSPVRETSEHQAPPRSHDAQQEPIIDPTSTQAQDLTPKPHKKRSRMTRQEEVFSGQQRLKPQTTALPDPEHFQKQRPSASTKSREQKEEWEREQYDSTPRLGFFARVRRAFKRTVLTAFAFGAGAYGIGVVAEGLQARAQVVQGDVGGPMKRLVLENDARRDVGARQRAGIFSTESSR